MVFTESRSAETRFDSSSSLAFEELKGDGSSLWLKLALTQLQDLMIS